MADDGPGLSDEVRAKLFTPYFTTKARGTGLGLAIVHRIVSDHGGEIRVGGAPGQGAVFTVALPVEGPTVGASSMGFADANPRPAGRPAAAGPGR